MKNHIFYLFLFLNLHAFSQKLPKGFVYISDVDKSIKIELRYFSNNNFIGKAIDGYNKDCVIVTVETAKALKKIQKKLREKGYSLKIFDAYRPQQAVNHFVRWAKVFNDTLMKKEYYPDIPKSELFKQGFIAYKSGHTRGSTVDLTLVKISDSKEIDMGSNYDFFGIQSHPNYKNISTQQQKNRQFLRNIMLRNGFKPYENEWWHFTLKEEPFPNTYFNFPIE